MQITKEEVNKIIEKVKECVYNGLYKISINPNRIENETFINEYRLTTKRQEEMILALDVYDFSRIDIDKNNNIEILYFFGKEYELNHVERGMENIEVYIKFTIKQRRYDEFMMIISFHKANWPIKYHFKNS
ncbi:hypothetical protein PN398_09970 [Romboutsia sp. 1001216sp1]|uniref:hypothetical protein n=1 Tax=unclassified Romboutsia TaxID=2626894 RepID=UPI00189F58F9|nr:MULTISPECIES: hypothetical protein [unclassified Romboutsia]MDB8791053.1 hypothetical protein [Romboutsia sp. 1001216sp1]MDB8801228.1 hypothetical protein [Romboutsia sp. 1001216sp1]MDB8812627.1 hypothetical protein [Romboutsia sp. 1001216sp1]